MSTPPLKMRNIGPKSAAWLRQVGIKTPEALAEAGTLEAFMRVKRAGFKPSLNLLYALEGALQDCHWQEVPDARRVELVAEAEAAIAGLPPPRNRPAASPVTTTVMMTDHALHAMDAEAVGMDADVDVVDADADAIDARERA